MLRWLIVPVTAAVAALPGVGAGYAAPPDVSDQDKAFLIGAHQDNLTEIQAGQAAEEKADSQAVRDAGARFVKEHTALDEQVTNVAGKLGLDLPSRPTEQQQAELRRVAAKRGAEFDRAWVASQVKGHHKTLASVDKEVSEGSSEQVKKLAQDARPVVREHLDLVEGMESSTG